MNHTPEIHVEALASKGDIARLSDILNEYNSNTGVVYNPQSLSVFIRDDQGNVLGGLTGSTHWGWLRIKLLAVESELRGKGLGSSLLNAAEEEARARGCKNVLVDTFSFQSADFYRKHGFEVIAELDDYPTGHQRILLKKGL